MSETLTATAEARRSRVVGQADLTARLDLERAFRVAAASAVMGTSVKPFKLDLFHRLGHIASAREISEHHLERPATTSPEDWYAKNQGAYYALRNAFEDHWIGGRQAIYFALLLDGLGPPQYGDYTLVVDPARTPGVDLACFPGNTAERYAASGVLDETLCTSEIAPWDLRGDLLAIKHAGSLPLDSAEWAALVCHNTHYSETVVIGSLPLAAVPEIRVNELDCLRWRWLRNRKLNKLPLTAEELDQVWGLDLIVLWRDTYGTRIVGI